MLPPGQDRHIATFTVKVPADKAGQDVRVLFGLDRNGCVYVQSAQVMQLVEEPPSPPTDEKKETEEKEEPKKKFIGRK